MAQITPNSGIGDRIRDARQDRDLTLEQLADAAGVARSTLSRIERGQDPKHLDAVAIASALGLSVEELHQYERAAQSSNDSAQQTQGDHSTLREQPPTSHASMRDQSSARGKTRDSAAARESA